MSLNPDISGVKHEVVIHWEEIESISDLSSVYQTAVKTARAAMDRAYAPYSNFKVGAVVLFDDGTLTEGNNQENAAYPSGLCAERVALFSAHSIYPEKHIKALFIAAQGDIEAPENPTAPCGACRQVMLEYEVFQEEPFEVLLIHPSGKIYKFHSAGDLLPLAFVGKGLKRH